MKTHFHQKVIPLHGRVDPPTADHFRQSGVGTQHTTLSWREALVVFQPVDGVGTLRHHHSHQQTALRMKFWGQFCNHLLQHQNTSLNHAMTPMNVTGNQDVLNSKGVQRRLEDTTKAAVLVNLAPLRNTQELPPVK